MPHPPTPTKRPEFIIRGTMTPDKRKSLVLEGERIGMTYSHDRTGNTTVCVYSDDESDCGWWHIGDLGIAETQGLKLMPVSELESRYRCYILLKGTRFADDCNVSRKWTNC